MAATTITAGGMERNPALVPEASLAPVTIERKVRADLETSIPKPYMARGLVAPDMEHPNGTPGHRHNGMSVLQQHAAFFDQDDDGIIYPWETYTGFRQLGFNVIGSFIMAIVIHSAMSYPTLRGGFLLLYFRYIFIIYTSASMEVIPGPTTEKAGKYLPVHFENIFSKYARTVPDKLTLGELWDMTQANREVFDFFGWIATKMEWGILYLLAKDEDGFLSKEAIRRCFDGSLFDYCAKVQTGGDYAKKE